MSGLRRLIAVGQAWLLVLLTIPLGLAGAPGSPSAHEMSMAEMQVRETTRGTFLWQWSAGEKRAPGDALRPVWPSGCQADTSTLRCGPQGLQGTLAMGGVGQGFSAAMVKVFWLDGQSRVYTLTKGQPTVQLYGAADDGRGPGQIARAYTGLGVEHILSGFDHLLFVIGLLFLVGFNKRLLLTITAFTIAHSLTLACSALGWLALRSPPVEATIALSILLVAADALHQRHTLARRWPALLAFLFGLVHGLGFAGALKEIGLPQQHLFVALLSFNLGGEAGQLLTVRRLAAVRRPATLAALAATAGAGASPHQRAVCHRQPGRVLVAGPHRGHCRMTTAHAAVDEVISLFPTPFLRAPATLGNGLVAGLVQHFSSLATRDNSASSKLSHTALLQPGDSPLLLEVARLVSPKLVDFGALLFGERLGWSIKEMWVNLLEPGGHQAMHNHANSFVSGVLYLSATHPGAQTVFMKSPGGTDFIFKNDHAGMAPSAFNADKWVSPAPQPGDLVLFPSYLPHAVPPNTDPQRISMAFNAIPTRLNSWGYTVAFAG